MPGEQRSVLAVIALVQPLREEDLLSLLPVVPGPGVAAEDQAGGDSGRNDLLRGCIFGPLAVADGEGDGVGSGSGVGALDLLSGG